jgi:hypothetical protein
MFLSKLRGRGCSTGVPGLKRVWDVSFLIRRLFRAGSEPLTGRPHESLTLDPRIGVSVPSQSDEPRVYDQGQDVPGLFQMW